MGVLLTLAVLVFGVVFVIGLVLTTAVAQKPPSPANKQEPAFGFRDKVWLVREPVAGKKLRVTNRSEPSGYIGTSEIVAIGIYKQFGHFYLGTDSLGRAFRLDRLQEVVDLSSGEAFDNAYAWAAALGVDVNYLRPTRTKPI